MYLLTAVQPCFPLEVHQSLNTSDVRPQFPPMSRPCTCSHSRLISDSVSEEVHKVGKVRCVEYGGVILNPYFQRETKGT